MAEKALESLSLPGLSDTYVNTPLSTAPTFDNTTAYAVGDYVFYNRKLYKFNAAHSAGNWNGSQVEEVTISNEIKEIENDLQQLDSDKYEKPSGGIPASDLASGVIPDVPVTDVQVNGTSILGQDGVVNIPKGGSGGLGVVRTNLSYGIYARNDGTLSTVTASDSEVKSGANDTKCIQPVNQHMSTFYGLAKAAGDMTQSSSENAVGTYTDNAKTAIQTMLDVPSKSDIPDVSGKADKVQSATSGNFASLDSNGNLVDSGHKHSDYLTQHQDISGKADKVINATSGNFAGLDSNGNLYDSGSKPSDFLTQHQDISGKADKVQNATNGNFASLDANGNLTDSGHKHSDYLTEAPVTDVQINETSILGQDGIANIPAMSSSVLGVAKVGLGLYISGTTKQLNVNTADSESTKNGIATSRILTNAIQHEAAFYGLAKAAGDTTQASSSNAVGTYTDDAKSAIQTMLDVPSTDDIPEVPVTDVQINGTSVLNQGVANIPLASYLNAGVTKTDSDFGVGATGTGFIAIMASNLEKIKSGAENYRPLVPSHQHESVFYGLAKVAGDMTQSSSENAVGTYTDSAKASIKAMLGVNDVVTDVTVSGTTPVITAVANTRYICGEVATIDFTPSSTGICDVIFESGSTATVLTLPNTVKMPEWFDSSTLEADTIYEISIVDGVYGAVMSWQA